VPCRSATAVDRGGPAHTGRRTIGPCRARPPPDRRGPGRDRARRRGVRTRRAGRAGRPHRLPGVRHAARGDRRRGPGGRRGGARRGPGPVGGRGPRRPARHRRPRRPGATVDGARFAHYVCFATVASPRADALVHLPALVDVNRRVLGPRPGCSTTSSSAWSTRTPAPARIGLLAHRLAHRPPVRAAPRRVAGARLHHPLRPHLAGQRLPAGPAREPPRRDRGHPAGLRARTGRDRRLPGAGRRAVPRRRSLAQRGRATAEGAPAVRRHLRGSWHGGTRLDVGHGTDDFVKNAAR